jgi:hypothetical protein
MGPSSVLEGYSYGAGGRFVAGFLVEVWEESTAARLCPKIRRGGLGGW